VPLFSLIQRAGLAASGGEARRLVKGRGAKVNDRTIDVETQPITLSDVSGEGVIKLSAGKKRHALVKAV
jgi:tyrosyl-tRNA synthetase